MRSRLSKSLLLSLSVLKIEGLGAALAKVGELYQTDCLGLEEILGGGRLSGKARAGGWVGRGAPRAIG